MGTPAFDVSRQVLFADDLLTLLDDQATVAVRDALSAEVIGRYGSRSLDGSDGLDATGRLAHHEIPDTDEDAR